MYITIVLTNHYKRTHPTDGDDSFADLCVYTIMVCSKWDGLLAHRVVTPTKIFGGKIAPRAGFYSDLHQLPYNHPTPG